MMMLPCLIKDIELALDNNLYFVALCAALTLPDICGKIAYPEEKSTRKRYTLWCNEEFSVTERPPDSFPCKFYLTGEVVYSLRCSLLHAGSTNIRNKDLKDIPHISNFRVVLDKPNKFNTYLDSMSISSRGTSNYFVSVQRLCRTLCRVAEGYYNANKEKFKSNNNIIDMDSFGISSVDSKSIMEEVHEKLKKQYPDISS